MLHFLTTYRRFIIVLLAIVLAVPCSVKKELKQQFQPETSQSTNSNSPKIGCTTCCSVYLESNKKHTLRKATLPFSYVNTYKNKIVTDVIFPALDAYHFYKEKIPTHIRNQQFLI